VTAASDTCSTYVCEHCGTTGQWSCRCWEVEAAKYVTEQASRGSQVPPPAVSSPTSDRRVTGPRTAPALREPVTLRAELAECREHMDY